MSYCFSGTTRSTSATSHATCDTIRPSVDQPLMGRACKPLSSSPADLLLLLLSPCDRLTLPLVPHVPPVKRTHDTSVNMSPALLSMHARSYPSHAVHERVCDRTTSSLVFPPFWHQLPAERGNVILH